MLGTISTQVRDTRDAFRMEAAWTAAMYNVIKGGLDRFCPFTPRATSLTLFIGLHVCTLSSLTDELRLEGERGGVGGEAECCLKGSFIALSHLSEAQPAVATSSSCERENGNRLLFGTACMTHKATMGKIQGRLK